MPDRAAPPGIDMTPSRWRYTTEYLQREFGQQDVVLDEVAARGAALGLPAHAVSADVGRLLMLLASTTAGRLAIEVGTLGGYSGVWLARGLRSSGQLITVERDVTRAEFARSQFREAGVGARVDVRTGDALAELKALSEVLPPLSVDVVFLDADKSEYPLYFAELRPLIAPGGVLLADNVLGSSSGWWIDHEGHAQREGAHALNQSLARDPDFEAVAVPLREGLLIARRMRSDSLTGDRTDRE